MITESLHERGNIQSSFDYFLKYKINKNSKILDIGCNYGSLVNLITNKGYNEVYGIDINNNVLLGKKYYSSIKDNIDKYDGNKIPFEDESFDVVMMFDVIEHIPKINVFLKNEVYRILKNNGLFLFQTPNKITDIPYRIVTYKSFTSWRLPGMHCSLQTVYSLKKLLKFSGFNDIIINKNNIITDFNKGKVKKQFGVLGLFFLKIFSKLPLIIFPNLWGNAKKNI